MLKKQEDRWELRYRDNRTPVRRQKKEPMNWELIRRNGYSVQINSRIGKLLSHFHTAFTYCFCRIKNRKWKTWRATITIQYVFSWSVSSLLALLLSKLQRRWRGKRETSARAVRKPITRLRQSGKQEQIDKIRGVLICEGVLSKAAPVRHFIFYKVHNHSCNKPSMMLEIKWEHLRTIIWALR